MDIHEIFENAYVVTNGGERLEQFKSVFKAAGLPECKEWRACMIKGEGQMGNSVSQYSLVRHAKEANLPFLVVFEDDAVPSDDAEKEIVSAFENRKDDCLCLTLGWSYDSDPDAGEDKSKHRRVYGSHAYALFGEKAYDAYVSQWQENGRADVVISKMAGATMNGKNLFAQHSVGETIHLPHGWTIDSEMERMVDREAGDRFSKARAAVDAAKAKDTIHVAYTIDIQGKGAQQFNDQLYVSARSLKLSKAKDDDIVVHVMYNEISVDMMERLHALESDGFKVVGRKLARTDMDYWQQFSKYDPESPQRSWGGIVYARLWLPLLLPDVKRCIYLDSDTLVRASLKDFYSSDLEGKPLGMVMGSIAEYGYNSGVMLMDLEAMRSDGSVYGKLEKFMAENARKFYCPDQTVINKFFEGRIKEFGQEWNYPPNQGVVDQFMPKAKVLHFYNGTQKPYNLYADDFGRCLDEWNRILLGR